MSDNDIFFKTTNLFPLKNMSESLEDLYKKNIVWDNLSRGKQYLKDGKYLNELLSMKNVIEEKPFCNKNTKSFTVLVNIINNQIKEKICRQNGKNHKLPIGLKKKFLIKGIKLFN